MIQQFLFQNRFFSNPTAIIIYTFKYISCCRQGADKVFFSCDAVGLKGMQFLPLKNKICGMKTYIPQSNTLKPVLSPPRRFTFLYCASWDRANKCGPSGDPEESYQNHCSKSAIIENIWLHIVLSYKHLNHKISKKCK